jgi:hypothetical protein
MNNASLINCIVAIVLLVFGTASATGAFFLLRQTYRKTKKWATAFGTITGYAEHYNARQGIFFRPQVQFSDTNGKEFTFKSSIGSRRKPYRIGASVKVLYPLDNPADADIKSFTSLWLPPLFLLVFVVGFLGMSFYLFFLALHKK